MSYIKAWEALIIILFMVFLYYVGWKEGHKKGDWVGYSRCWEEKRHFYKDHYEMAIKHLKESNQ